MSTQQSSSTGEPKKKLSKIEEMQRRAQAQSRSGGTNGSAVEALLSGTGLRTTDPNLLKPLPPVATATGQSVVSEAGIPARTTPVAALPTGERVVAVPLDQIVESQENSRFFFDPKELEKLAEAMKAQGQLEPAHAFVRADGRYELLGGHRRFRAARQVALPSLKLIVVPAPGTPQERARLSRTLNGNRRDTTFLDDAMRWRQFIDSKLFASQQELAAFMSVSETAVTKALAVADMPLPVLEAAFVNERWHGVANLYCLSQMLKVMAGRVDDAAAWGVARIHKANADNTVPKLEQELARLRGENPARPERAKPGRTMFEGPRGRGALKLFEKERKLELKLENVAPELLERLHQEVGRLVRGLLDQAEKV
jgi:ParB/RepB/Spo0J family partition protein